MWQKEQIFTGGNILYCLCWLCADAGIKLYGGVSGSADEAVKALLEDQLNFNPDVQCSHHEHEHGGSCGGHSCGEDKHGCPGSHV